MAVINNFPINTSTISERLINTGLQDGDLFITRQAGIDKQYSATLLKQEVAQYVANGDAYTDSGVANTYVLAPIDSKQAPLAYTDQMRIRFATLNPNTTTATVDVNGLGVKDIRNSDGSVVVANQVRDQVQLVFDLANDWFELIKSGGGGAVGGGADEVFYLNDINITEDYTIPDGKNAGTFGPITIADGVVVTVSDLSTWSIV